MTVVATTESTQTAVVPADRTTIRQTLEIIKPYTSEAVALLGLGLLKITGNILLRTHPEIFNPVTVRILDHPLYFNAALTTVLAIFALHLNLRSNR